MQVRKPACGQFNDNGPDFAVGGKQVPSVLAIWNSA